MTLKGTEKLLLLLRAHGVSHFKTAEVEIRIGVPPSLDSVIAVGAPPINMPIQKPPATAAAIPPVKMEIPHHINEAARLLKLSDEELVNEMFPTGEPQEKAE